MLKNQPEPFKTQQSLYETNTLNAKYTHYSEIKGQLGRPRLGWITLRWILER
jgi:hypothetical protein